MNRIIYREPVRKFEKTGVVVPEASYYVPLENVVNSDNQDIKTMVDLGRYFSIFAPQQSGKSTFPEATCDQLHKDSTYVVILLSFQEFSTIDSTYFYQLLEKEIYTQLLKRLNEVGCEKCTEVSQFKKIVIFIDEFDGIPLSELANFLTSLRELYLKYKKVSPKALYSIGLVGIRNVTKLILGGVSPFNIADHVDMPAFTLKNVRDLYAQHTEETNQPFSDAAVNMVYEETAGQPWLVNRLGTILTVKIKPGTVETIGENDVKQAIEILLQERNDHFDNLYEKAVQHKETFVEIIFDHVEYNPYDRDQGWLEQYGLIKNREGHAVVANNIYKAFTLKRFLKKRTYTKINRPRSIFWLVASWIWIESSLISSNILPRSVSLHSIKNKRAGWMWC